jgi:hypothetical protein
MYFMDKWHCSEKSAGLSSETFQIFINRARQVRLRRGPNLEKKTQYFRSEFNYLQNFLYKRCRLWLIFMWLCFVVNHNKQK